MEHTQFFQQRKPLGFFMFLGGIEVEHWSVLVKKPCILR